MCVLEILPLRIKVVTCIMEILWLCNKKSHVYSGDNVVMQQETARVSWRHYCYVTRNATCILEILLLCNKKSHVYPGDTIVM